MVSQSLVRETDGTVESHPSQAAARSTGPATRCKRAISRW